MPGFTGLQGTVGVGGNYGRGRGKTRSWKGETSRSKRAQYPPAQSASTYLCSTRWCF